MRILVISDTHGYLESARRVIRERGPWDHIIHLGDSVLDAVELAAELGVDITVVRGNNEYPGSPETDDELVFEAGGVRFYAIHGHRLDLNPYAGNDQMEAALSAIEQRAKETRSQIALFGHTHHALIRDQRGVLLINPGAMGLVEKRMTYAVITVDKDEKIKALIKENKK